MMLGVLSDDVEVNDMIESINKLKNLFTIEPQKIIE